MFYSRKIDFAFVVLTFFFFVFCSTAYADGACPIAVDLGDDTVAIIDDEGNMLMGEIVSDLSNGNKGKKIKCHKKRNPQEGEDPCLDQDGNCAGSAPEGVTRACLVTVRPNGNPGPCACVSLPQQPQEEG